MRDRGWTHHIQRLMVLGNHALQRGYRPRALSDWFREAFVDGFEWVMPTNVIGMSQHADGGLLATKPYASGGAYINRMSDHCGDCAFDPRKRLGDDACPFTAGYWAWVHRHRELLAANNRTARAVARMERLADLDAVLEQEAGAGGLLIGLVRGARYSERVSRAQVRDLVGTLARLGLAAVFLVSGMLKAIDPDRPSSPSAPTTCCRRPRSPSSPACCRGWRSPSALLLLAGIAHAAVAVASAGLLLVFIAGVTQAWARGLSIDCGCFGGGGAVDPGRRRTGGSSLRDAGFLLLAGVAGRPAADARRVAPGARHEGEDLTWVERRATSASGARRPRRRASRPSTGFRAPAEGQPGHGRIIVAVVVVAVLVGGFVL